MPKLCFRYGTINSSKTAHLLMLAHSYESKDNCSILIMKPSIDDREGKEMVYSRVGLARIADYVLDPYDKIQNIEWSDYKCILVDEAHFLTAEQVNILRNASKHVPIFCYGLRTDYMNRAFEGSRRLLEVADNLEEIKTVCHFCTNKAICSLKYDKTTGVIIKDGGQEVDIGYHYIPACWECNLRVEFFEVSN